ncbi:hypothetical protein CR513_38969, partial [Mucuna pruriens]
MAMHETGSARSKDAPILFSNEDYEGMLPHEDDPMVILVVVVKYKIKSVQLPRKLDECALLEYFPTNGLVGDKAGNYISKTENMLATPQILTRLVEGTPLLIYLAISNEVQGTPRSQIPLSKDREGNPCGHSDGEKIVSHKIIIRKELPIKQVLQKLEPVGRMVGWLVKLSKFDISYERKGHLTAIGEEKKENNKRTLSIDGASNKKGSGVGIIVERPDGFKANNNQAKYEALIVGIKLAKELGAKLGEWQIPDQGSPTDEILGISRRGLFSKLASTKKLGNNYLPTILCSPCLFMDGSFLGLLAKRYATDQPIRSVEAKEGRHLIHCSSTMIVQARILLLTLDMSKHTKSR